MRPDSRCALFAWWQVLHRAVEKPARSISSGNDQPFPSPVVRSAGGGGNMLPEDMLNIISGDLQLLRPCPADMINVTMAVDEGWIGVNYVMISVRQHRTCRRTPCRCTVRIIRCRHRAAIPNDRRRDQQHRSAPQAAIAPTANRPVIRGKLRIIRRSPADLYVCRRFSGLSLHLLAGNARYFLRSLDPIDNATLRWPAAIASLLFDQKRRVSSSPVRRSSPAS